MSYPTTAAGRQTLADQLTARGLVPTQGKRDFDRAKLERMADAMRRGTFDWSRAGLQPVILGPGGEVLGGHHRVVAAHLAGIDLLAFTGLRPQVYRLPVCHRPVYRWVDALPDVP